MSLVHVVVTKITGYELLTLYFDNREEEEVGAGNPFPLFEKEFIHQENNAQNKLENNSQISYYGYFIFPKITAEELYDLYKGRCEARPMLKKRYNIYFDKEHTHLEEMIKKFDRPIDIGQDVQSKYKTYSHRLEYIERSMQILRDIQTAIYEMESGIAAKELDLHKRLSENN